MGGLARVGARGAGGTNRATFDALMGIDAIDEPGVEIGPLAFYGRCSTEDNQDPETSRAWQLNDATKFVQPLGGHIATEFFDIGQSRSVPGSAGRRRPL